MEKLIKGILVVCLVVGVVGFAGCKKDEPVEPEGAINEAVGNQEIKVSEEEKAIAEAMAMVAKMSEQTKCPVMGGDIDKNILVTYKDKKVYFCCKGCIAKFESDPEAYVAKLPQFKIK
ncbi:MAG: YHS domain-containing protein [Planctomycetes bacterium]|nr:YHS domain-containing protein [Planctomycetota bacterium]